MGVDFVKSLESQCEELIHPKAALAYGQIRSLLESKGRPIGPMDLLLAAQAKSHNLVLVTNNEKEFKRIEGLRLENWTTASA